MHGESDCVTI